MLNNQPELAEPLLNQLTEMTDKFSNGNSVAIASAKYRYAVALCRQGKYETAEPILAEVLGIQKQELGLTNSATNQTLKAYALLLKQTKQTEKIEQLNQTIRTAQQQDPNSRLK